MAVGNSALPFPRLVAAVTAGIERRQEIASGIFQAGSTPDSIAGLRRVEFLSRSEFDAAMRGADLVICHGGVGALHAAIAAGHVPLVMPRRVAQGEIVNDHQLELAGHLYRRGMVLPFATAAELAVRVDEALARRKGPGSLLPDGDALTDLSEAIDRAAADWSGVGSCVARQLLPSAQAVGVRRR